MTGFEIALCAGVSQFAFYHLLSFGRSGFVGRVFAHVSAAVPSITLAYILASYALEIQHDQPF